MTITGITRLLLISFAIAVVTTRCRAESDRFKFSGPQGHLAETIERYSKAHDYKAIVSLLDGDYTDVVDAKSVVEKSQAIGWELTITSLGTSERFSTFAFVPIRGRIRIGQRENLIDSVLFFKIAGDKWTLINFPFIPDYFPTFGALPVMKSL